MNGLTYARYKVTYVLLVHFVLENSFILRNIYPAHTSTVHPVLTYNTDSMQQSIITYASEAVHNLAFYLLCNMFDMFVSLVS